MHASRNQALVDAFAAEMKTRRKSMGISQEELAHRAGVNRTYVARIELARNQPSLSVLFHLCDGLGVAREEFVAKIRSRLTAQVPLRSKISRCARQLSSKQLGCIA